MNNYNNWDFSNGLPPKKKHILGDEFEIITGESIFRTNIDGYPYLVLDVDFDVLNKKDKFSIDGEQGMYTVTFIDVENRYMEAKIDKVLDLSERKVNQVIEYYKRWGMQKEADEVKANYLWGYLGAFINVELCVDGKLSKNQVVQYGDDIIKITELVKREDKLIEIVGAHINRPIIQPIFPYKENGEVVCWYENMGDIWLRKAKEFNKIKNGGV